jgi:hypothetical protein
MARERVANKTPIRDTRQPFRHHVRSCRLAYNAWHYAQGLAILAKQYARKTGTCIAFYSPHLVVISCAKGQRVSLSLTSISGQPCLSLPHWPTGWAGREGAESASARFDSRSTFGLRSVGSVRLVLAAHGVDLMSVPTLDYEPRSASPRRRRRDCPVGGWAFRCQKAIKVDKAFPEPCLVFGKALVS